MSALAAIVATYLVEPTYRATAALTIENRTLPPEIDESAARDYAWQHLQARHRRALEAEGADVPNRAFAGQGPEQTSVRLAKMTVAPAEGNGQRSVSIAFTVAARHANPHEAERLATALVERYVEDDLHAAAIPAAPPPELEAARLESDRLAETRRDVEAQLESFRREHSAVLAALEDVDGAAMEHARSERLQLERQIGELEARRIELDRGLRDMQQGTRESSRGQSEPLTSEALAALQTDWAILRGRYGIDYPDAIELGERIRGLQAQAQRSLAAATSELADERAELARRERLHTIDYPDVVSQAHLVSALESRFEGARIRGLTNGDITYVESVARERRELDGRLEESRQLHATLQASVADYQARATEAPLVKQQYLTLEKQLTDAQGRHDAARDRQRLLETELGARLEQRPGQLSIVVAPQARRSLLTRASVILALGAALGLVAALLVVAVVERLDRRIAGATAIERIQGSAPLAEIPFIALAANT